MRHDTRTRTPLSATPLHKARVAGQPKFALGCVVSTPGALEAFNRAQIAVEDLLWRHRSGDWGEISDEDKAENELSVNQGFRLLSSYTLPSTGETVWIITEADRSSTTLLLPSEY